MKTTSPLKKASVQAEVNEKEILLTQITAEQNLRKKNEENENQLQNIFLNAPAAIAIFEGPEHKYILANKAYEKLSNRKAADLLGKSMQVLFPELKGTGTLELFTKVLKTGESFSAPEYALMLDLTNEGILRQYYFNFSMEPLKNNSGEIYAVMAVTYDITEQVESRKKIEESENRFKNVLIQSPNIFLILEGFPEMIITFANEPLLKSWGRTDAIIGKPILEVVPEIKDQPFPKLLQQVFETGKTYNSGEEKAMIIKNGVSVDNYYNYVYQAVFDSNQKVTGIIIMATDITEQVKAKIIIKESEKQQAFLLRFSDTLREESNVDALANRSLQMLSEHLKLDRCYIGVYQLAEDLGVFPYQAGNERVPPIPASVCLSDFPDALRVAFDRTLVIDDVAKAKDLSDADRQNLGALGLCALVAATLRHGEDNPLWSIVAVSASPRRWTLSEVTLIEEVTERTWAALERAKAEKALRQSEEKYRMLFNSMDEGFCTLRVLFDDAGKAIDCLYLEVNTAFVTQSGLENVVGKTMLEVNPETEEFWIETYGRISRTGKAERFEHVVSQLQKFYEFYAFRFVESGENRVAVIFNNITERKNAENRQTYLLKLSDAIKELIDPVDIQITACRILGEHMKVNRVLYTEVINEELVVINNNYVNGVTPIIATLNAEQFGKNVIDAFKRNKKVIFSDINTDSRYTEDEKQSFLALNVVANVGIGLVKGGRWVATFGVHQNVPRNWTDCEIFLMEETSERTWAAVERAKSEEASQKSEEKYRSLFNSIQDAFCIIEMIFDENGEPIDWIYLETNPAFLEHATMEMKGKRISEIVPEMEAFWLEKYGNVAKTGVPVQLEHIVKGLGDQWFQTSAFRHGPEGSKKVAVLFRNITEQKTAEEKIRESEKQLAFDLADAKKLQTFSTQIIHEENIDLLYEQLVDAAIALMQSDMASIQLYHPEKKQLELLTYKGFHPESAANWEWVSTDSESLCSAAMRNGERFIVSDLEKDDLMVKKGGLYYYQLSGIRAAQSTPLISRNGDLVGMISTHWREPHQPTERQLQLFDVLSRQAADLIERKKTEGKLMKAKVSAENATKAKQQFLSNMSHEIRTPLNSILGFANVLMKTELNAEQKEFLQAIKTSGNSLNLLINDILDLAKVDAGRMTFVKQPFEIRKSIESLLYSFDLKIKEKNLKLVKVYDSKIPLTLLGDSVRLNQIILNLLSNAVKFTYEGKITQSVKLLDEDEENVNIEFTITDTGIGIAPDKINSIFNLFEQAELSTSNSYGGTGLGLAIVKQLIEDQGGSISLKSRLGEGSTFSFILPFSKTNVKAEEEIEILTLNKEIKNPRVLVAEDVALNQLLIKIILNDFGFEHEIVSNGKLAVEKMKTNTYDIILMDLHMPEMNGYEATEYIRKILKSQIPIIALTADVITTDISKCKEFGIDDYVSKPINENLLYCKIVELVKKSQ